MKYTRRAEELQWHCIRFTKNQAEPKFTDQELLTTYLFNMAIARRFTVKDIYDYIHHHWLNWFPSLPSYTAYNIRLNRVAAVFPLLASRLTFTMERHLMSNPLSHSLTQCPSLPGVVSKKVAPELCDKSYNSTKNMYYFGMKPHSIGFHRTGGLPVPEYFQLGSASE